MADLRMEELSWKNVHGTLTPKEEREMRALAAASPENKELLDRMNSNDFRQKLQALHKLDLRRFDETLIRKMGGHNPVPDWPPKTISLQRLFRPMRIAASILLVAGLSWGIYYRYQRSRARSYPPIMATLTWQQTTVDLGDMGEGKAYKAGEVQIDRMGNEFFIHRRPDPQTTGHDIVQYNLNVQGKGDIQVFFQDTTRTQIYPKSGITFTSYPPDTLLTKKQMGCYGRVLFNVDHNSQIPFTVKTPKQEIAVLGTCFEVLDYNKEDTGATFCYTGKVRVKGPQAKSQVITGRQRITVDHKADPRISTGDFPEAQWSSAELVFNFSNINLDSAMKEIAQWYDIPHVHFQPGIDRRSPGTVYTGKISRYLSLQQLLAILERDDLHFSIRDQTILVKK